MIKKLKNLIDVSGKPIYIIADSKTENARNNGRIAGKRFFNTFSKKR